MSGELTIVFGKERKSFPASSLSAEFISKLVKEIQDEKHAHVTMQAHKVHEWSEPDQTAFWQTCHAVGQVCSLKLKVNKAPFNNVVDCAVNIAAQEANSTRRQAAIRCALIAVNVSCATSLAINEALAKLCAQFNENAVLKINIKTLREELKSLATLTNEEKPETDPTVLAKGFHAALQALQEPRNLSARALNFFNGEFYLRDGGRWKPMGDQELRARVTAHLQSTPAPPKVANKLVGDVVENLKGLTLVACGNEPLPFLIEEYSQQPRIRRPNYVVFQNGMVEIDTTGAEMSELTLSGLSSDYFTTSQLPFNYDPAAKCPRFLEFLYHVLECDDQAKCARRGGDRRVRVLQEFFGYTLLSDGRMQKFLVMFGDGANGKSVLTHLLTKMLGEPNVSHVGLDQLNGTFALEPLIGKAANICGDLNEIDGVSEGVLKQLTGGDNMTVHRKNRSSLTMQAAVKLVFATNTLPRFKDRSAGVWRRLIAMPFRIRIAEKDQDPLLGEKLEAELPGIINWALCGLQRLLKNKKFSDCAVCNDAQRQHRVDCDPIQQFADECLVVAPESSAIRSEVYDRYSEWCVANGRQRAGSSEFGKHLRRLFPNVEDGREGSGHRRHVYRNISLRDGSVPGPEDEYLHRGRSGNLGQRRRCQT